MSKSYDVTVIGAGPGGYTAAIRCAQLGLKTAIVESDAQLGGTCLLRGCIPTKALLESAYLLHKMQESAKYGIVTQGVELDFGGVQKARQKAVTVNSKGVEYLMRKNKIDVFKGVGGLAGKGKVKVVGDSTETFDSKHVIIATGSSCKDFPGIEMDHVRTVNSDDILEITEVPESLIVMGAGAVGTEFASCYADFGSKVTLVEYMDTILPLEDAEISKDLQRTLKKRGIDVRAGSAVSDVKLVDGGVECMVAAKKGNKKEKLTAKMLLVAVGRAPVTEGLGLKGTKVEIDKHGKITVDENLRTGEPNVFAIGDVIHGPMLAHKASHDGVFVAELIAGKDVHPPNYNLVPNCTYCFPEVASVGLTEAQAIEKGYDVKIGKFPFSANGKARIMGADSGMVKFVADKKYDELLGVHIVGPKATELISELVLAMHLESTVEEIVHSIHPHPTLAEAIGEAATAAFNGAPLNF